jgi:hypothetical protein
MKGGIARCTDWRARVRTQLTSVWPVLRRDRASYYNYDASRNRRSTPWTPRHDARGPEEVGGEYVYGLKSVEAVLARVRQAGSASHTAHRDVNSEGCNTQAVEGEAEVRQEGRQLWRLFLLRQEEQDDRRSDDGRHRPGVGGKRSAGAEGVRAMAEEMGVPVEFLPRPSLSKLSPHPSGTSFAIANELVRGFQARGTKQRASGCCPLLQCPATNAGQLP